MTEGTVVHKGGCHCGSVRFEVRAPEVLTVIDCNCSICVKKQNRIFIVPLCHFKLLKGHDALKTYSFGTHQAKHYFCRNCGVQSFYIPRSNPDGYGVAVHCLDEGTVKKIKTEKFNGKDWDEAIKKSAHIKDYSKGKHSP
uniref:Centromere protein V-like n=1 Tax=Hirondellea gigas TaxID=1518452 RepID=A0A2P2HXJ5_9CRUS